MRSTKGRMLFAVAAAVATLALARGLTLLPYGAARDAVSDTMALPGAVIAGIFYPGGVHTGAGSSSWGVVTFFGNLVFYSILWFVLFSLVRGRKEKTASGVGA